MKEALELYKRVKFEFRAPNLNEIVASCVSQLKNVFTNIDIQIEQLKDSFPHNVNHVNSIHPVNNKEKISDRLISDSKDTEMKDVNSINTNTNTNKQVTQTVHPSITTTTTVPQETQKE